VKVYLGRQNLQILLYILVNASLLDHIRNPETADSDMTADIPFCTAISLALKPSEVMQESRTAKPMVTNPNIVPYTVCSSNSGVPVFSSTISGTTISSSNFTNLTNHLLSPHVMISGKGRGTTLTNLASGQQNFSLAANFNMQGSKVGKKPTDTDKTESKSTFPEAPSGAALKSLMAPAAFQLTSPNVNKTDGETVGTNKNAEKAPVITKKEFQSILLNMIQTDNEFVAKLHNAFLEKLSQ